MHIGAQSSSSPVAARRPTGLSHARSTRERPGLGDPVDDLTIASEA